MNRYSFNGNFLVLGDFNDFNDDQSALLPLIRHQGDLYCMNDVFVGIRKLQIAVCMITRIGECC